MTRRRRIAAWLATLALGAAGVMTLTLAQEPPASATPPAGTTPPATASTPAPAESPTSSTDASAPEPNATETGEKPAAAAKPKPATAKGSPQHFEPTEKVRPDFDVAFPIDI